VSEWRGDVTAGVQRENVRQDGHTGLDGFGLPRFNGTVLQCYKDSSKRGLSPGVVVASAREMCRVIGAECASHPQFAHDSDHDRRDVRAVGPVADVLGDSFFLIVDNGS
jgi:hypothetical protein